MSLDFYDADGQPYAYTDDGETIYTFDGTPVAYIHGNSIYSFAGAHLGFFENGHVWDHSGYALLFTDGATGGPVKPVRGIKPVKGIRQIKEVKGIKEIKPIKPIRSPAWSSLSPQEVFEGGG